MKNKLIVLSVGCWAMFQSGSLYAQKLYIYDQNTNQPLNEAQVKQCDGQNKLNQTGIDGYLP